MTHRQLSWVGRILDGINLDTSSEGGLADWNLAKAVYDVHYKELERTASTAQGLIAAVTLTAALAGPLLVINIRRSMLDLVFGGCLLLYLVFVGIAVQRSIRALYSPLTDSYLVPSFLNHRYVATTFRDADSYLAHFSELTPQEKLEQVVKQTWVDAKLMNRKRDAVGSAVRWVQLSLLMLGLLVLLKYVTLVLQTP